MPPALVPWPPEFTAYLMAMPWTDEGRGQTSFTQEDLVAVFESHHSYLVSVLRFKTRSLDRAEDLVQDTYLAFLESRPDPRRFASPSKLKNFLLTIALNKLRDWARKQVRDGVRRAAFRSREDLDRCLDQLESGLQGPEDWVDAELQRLLADALVIALGRLSEAHQEVLRRRFEGGQDLPSLAQDLGLKLKAAESLLHRAKSRLKNELETVLLSEKGWAASDVTSLKEGPV